MNVAVACERPGVCEKYVSILHSESIVILKSREYTVKFMRIDRNSITVSL